MRRILPILLTISLGLGPALTAVPANAMATALLFGWAGKADESHLPACCRRNGQHHCAMVAQEQMSVPPAGTSIGVDNSCPFPLRTLASTASSIAALVNPRAASQHFLARILIIHAGAEKSRPCDLHACPKRGPPASQAL